MKFFVLSPKHLKKTVSLISAITLFSAFLPTQSFAASSWTNSGDMNYRRDYHTATLLGDGKVLVAGGENASCAIAQTELYDPTAKTWSATSGFLATGREYHTASLVTISGGGVRVLVAGGSAICGSGVLSSAELFNESTGTWSSAHSMTTARANFTATKLSNGKVLVVGGATASSYTDTVELYDPVADTWTTKAHLATARSLHTTTLLNDGTVLVTGGGNSSGTLSSTEIYNPTTDSWSAGPAMNYARLNHTATLLPDGTVLIVGGGDSTARTKSEKYEYNFATPVFDTVRTVNNTSGYIYHTATLVTLSDGITKKVLVAGGFLTGQTNAELYDYSADSWSNTTSMNSARGTFTATLLNDGTVLAAGGYGSSNYLKSSEYYTAP